METMAERSFPIPFVGSGGNILCPKPKSIIQPSNFTTNTYASIHYFQNPSKRTRLLFPADRISWWSAKRSIARSMAASFGVHGCCFHFHSYSRTRSCPNRTSLRSSFHANIASFDGRSRGFPWSALLSKAAHSNDRSWTRSKHSLGYGIHYSEYVRHRYRFQNNESSATRRLVHWYSDNDQSLLELHKPVPHLTNGRRSNPQRRTRAKPDKTHLYHQLRYAWTTRLPPLESHPFDLQYGDHGIPRRLHMESLSTSHEIVVRKRFTLRQSQIFQRTSSE